MKSLIFLLLLPFVSVSQTIETDWGRYVKFDLKYPVDSASTDIVNWKKENLSSTIILKGPVPITYTITVPNDTTAVIYKHEREQKVFQEKLEITDWILRGVEQDHIISEFKITDFDLDGDEDLLCWVFTNMNGNMWTLILLNDNNYQKLIKLWNTAEDTDIWDGPEYNAKDGTIITHLDASVYGISNEAVYKLEGLTAIPVSMLEEDHSNMRYILENEYIGKNGKWKRIKSKKTRG